MQKLLGADFGAGKRGNMFGSFMCGLRDSTSSDDYPKFVLYFEDSFFICNKCLLKCGRRILFIRFISFCRFGTGQTMKEAEDIK